jgi:acyl-homoserine-lactone acylase
MASVLTQVLRPAKLRQRGVTMDESAGGSRRGFFGWAWCGLLLALGLTALGLLVWEPMAATAPPAPPHVPHAARIVRDPFGVPHIFGRTDPDVAYGLAYAHAQDDFPTLQLVIAGTRGRSAAIGGKDYASLDLILALTDARAVARRRYGELPADTRALVEAYAAGLNAYAARHPEEVTLRKLFPVTGEDVVTGFVQRSPLFYGLDRVLTPLTEGRLPPRDGEPEPGSGAEPPPAKGSNAFAIAPARSGDGVTRLLSNSHQPWTGPAAWWEAVVHSESGWDFAGALFPGMPYPAMGHNKLLGWTNTINRPDLIDTYRLTVSDDNRSYLYDGQWRRFESRTVPLRVKIGPFVIPVPRQVKRSVHGFVIENEQGSFAIRYAGFGEVAQVDQYYRLNRADSFEAWQAAMARQAIPGTNFVYADAQGHIAYIYNAKFPARMSGFDWRGILPGDTSKAVWTSYVPFNNVPKLLDPKAGWVANANNKPFVATETAENLREADFAPELGIERFMTNRAHRFDELLQGPGAIPLERLLAVKFDKGYSKASWAGVWMAQLLAVPADNEPNIGSMQSLLSQWDWTLDGRGAADALAALALGEGARTAYSGAPLPDPEAVFRDIHGFLMQHWGRLDPPLAELMRVRRGTADAGTTGGPDALRAYYWERDADGRLKGNNGDSFIMLVEWGADGGVRSRSIQPFGAASERPASPHYADQLPLFAREQWKEVLFDPRALMAKARSETRIAASPDGSATVERRSLR